MTILSSMRLVPGVTAIRKEKKYKIISLLNSREVIAESMDGIRDKYNASEFTADLDKLSNDRNLVSIKDKQWERALELYEEIKPIIELGKKSKRSVIERVADNNDVSVSTVYRWISQYKSTGLISSLVRKRRSDIGKSRLRPEVEKIIVDVINEHYLTTQKRSASKAADEVKKICIQAGLSPPDKSTTRNRIYEIDEELRVRRRQGSKAAKELFDPLIGSFPGANFPLAVVQIDHTPVDAILVDDVHREPIGKAYLTIATDIFSKMTLGFYLSLDPPGALATGICISNSIMGKEVYLSDLGLDHHIWPCWGVMRTIHTDNAKEFRGTLLGKATDDYSIIAERRPKGYTNYGGHVERQFRTFMGEVHSEIPGTTFSNIQEKLDYDSEGHAVMTLDALVKWFTLYIVGSYHQQAHSGNDGMPPIKKWEEGIYGTDEVLGSGIPIQVADEERLRLDFLPFIERTVQEYGIQFETITYWSDAIRRFIHSKNPKKPSEAQVFTCRYDPRKLSKIWMFDPETDEYIEIPCRDLSRPDISLWELKAAKKRLRKISKSMVNEDLIFKTIDEMREVVKEESHKTKEARKNRQKQKQRDKAKKVVKSKATEIKIDEVADDVEDDFEFEPFDNIREAE